NGENAAHALHHAGLSSSDYMRGYHSGGAGEFCYVEEDGSVDGEIIYSRLRLSDAAHARKLEDALSVVQDLISEQEIGLDSRCGFPWSPMLRITLARLRVTLWQPGAAPRSLIARLPTIGFTSSLGSFRSLRKSARIFGIAPSDLR